MKTMRLLLATHNQHKAAEIGELLLDLPLRLTTYDEFPNMPEPDEDGKTLEDNASKKAAHGAGLSGLWTLADDTGLEVEALDGAPGVYSARYAGPDCDYADNNRKLLENLKGVPKGRRKAMFRTVMALASPDGRVTTVEGRLEGTILEEPRGRNGFGYDPVFLVSGRDKTLAELSSREKNAISHRSLAMANMKPHLRLLAAPVKSGASARRASTCPACSSEMESWHCREICRNCGYQIDCSDPFS